MTPSQHLQDTAMRYFLEVVRSGSVSEAALRLNVSASAVSRQIASLEEVLQVPLFERRPRGMVASAAGELLATHAKRHALDAERVVADIEALQGLRRGQVRVCASAGFAFEFLPLAMATFREQHPGMQFQLVSASPAQVTQAVRNGEADVGLTYSRAAVPDIDVQHRQNSPVILIMPPGHPLARFASVSLAQMHPYPLALLDDGNTARQLFDIASGQRGLVFEPVLESGQFDALVRFVLHGGGLTLGGEVTVREYVRRGLLHTVPLRERGMHARSIELQTLTGRNLPRGVRAFVDHLRALLPAQR
ncbi:LysR family transcriptional regulator [Comamonas piscis]|uniref:LysR family transcriptional regulator n=1 Tax=Comamonas piscis TaxID=1562974 RepID=A0A7G5EFZ4_9BURK|nr:LysR family transcriptional regulator [Comamonas piscis]QMV72919.1 LysR family transcriptional regulator [Comamonas piscis]WSO35700.1 LysR family transcriptional regulator [Comamonas piscis]